jgi:hypothetical protein
MSILNDILKMAGNFISDHADYFSLSIIATLLVIYGEDINNQIKKRIRSLHFFLRVLIFVLVSAFAYGLMTVLLCELLNVVIVNLSASALPPLMFAVFIVIGILAEKKHQI